MAGLRDLSPHGRPGDPPSIHVEPDPAALARAAAEEVAACARVAVLDRGRFLLGLAGGSTPRPAYELLAHDSALRQAVDWKRVHVYWSDERTVGPDDPASNYKMAVDALLAHVPVPAGQIHRFRGEARPESAAQEYDELLAGLARAQGFDVAALDLLLLGLGEDGHVASLFPGSPVLTETRRFAAAAWVPRLGTVRLTLTLPLINAARHIVFLVSGVEKAPVVRSVLEGGSDELPAALVRPRSGDVRWLLDSPAASLLDRSGG